MNPGKTLVAQLTDFLPWTNFARPGEARPPTHVMVAFVDDYRGVYGVEPICKVLEPNGNVPPAEVEAMYYQ